MKLQYFLFALVAFVLATSPVYGQQSPQTVIRDAGGRTIGTATTSSSGQTTFRDSRGMTTGTASPDGQGTTTYRNERGQTTGTSQSPLGRR